MTPNPMYGGQIQYGRGIPGLLDPEAWRNAQFIGNDSYGQDGGLLPSFLPQVPVPQMPEFRPGIGQTPDTPPGALPSQGHQGPSLTPAPFSDRTSGGGFYTDDNTFVPGMVGEEEPTGSMDDPYYNTPEWQQPEYASKDDWLSTAFPDLYDTYQGAMGWDKIQHRQNEGDAWDVSWQRDKPSMLAQGMGALGTLSNFTPTGMAKNAIGSIPEMASGLLSRFQTPSVETASAVTTGIPDQSVDREQLDSMPPTDFEQDENWASYLNEDSGEYEDWYYDDETESWYR